MELTTLFTGNGSRKIVLIGSTLVTFTQLLEDHRLGLVTSRDLRVSAVVYLFCMGGGWFEVPWVLLLLSCIIELNVCSVKKCVIIGSGTAVAKKIDAELKG